MKNINIKMVSVEEGITALGFRRVVAVARQLNPQTEVYFITPGNLYSLASHIFPSLKREFNKKDARLVAKTLAKADLLCFSSMTPSASYTEEIIAEVKKINPKVFILWGGAHCILHPNEAIKKVDAICTGEGEIPFQVFLNSFSSGKINYRIQSLWFRKGKRIIKNPNRMLNSTTELDSFPHLFYDLSCEIYDLKLKKFRSFTIKDYLKYNGLTYRTLWSIGCPFVCIYCANNAFINIDSNYRRIRYSSVDYLIEEIEKGIKTYPFISTVSFSDDNFIALPLEVIKEFARKYKKRINLPFVVFGLHPNLVDREKIEVLGKAGMNRGRMGIQSGCARILAFYNRPTTIKNIIKSASILGKAARKYKMIPPAYDIISDNPLETREDIIQTLQLLYNLERPYTLTVFSLRVFPKTALSEYFRKYPSIDISWQTSSYLDTRKTLTNILIYYLAMTKPPKFIFNWLLKYIKNYQDDNHNYPTIHLIIRTLYLSSRALDHLKKLDFSTIVGPFGYYLWKIGLIRSRFRPQAAQIRNFSI